MIRRIPAASLCLLTALSCVANDPPRVFVWPDLAPGESSRDTGRLQPFRPNEDPPVHRVTHVRRPSLEVFPAEDNANGTGILILPGGGFGKVVPNKEGSEAAPWLNGLGITVFVLNYRTNEILPKTEPAWKRPLQDAQRSLRLLRSRAEEWKLDPDRIGVLGFSAGGQVSAILHTATSSAYEALDRIDKQSAQPNFSLLIYPWRVLQPESATLLPDIRVTSDSPPAFLVHTHDDASSSVGSVLIYAALRRHKVPAELHVYANGGHGYGMRQVKGSNIGSWPNRATDWLRQQELTTD